VLLTVTCLLGAAMGIQGGGSGRRFLAVLLIVAGALVGALLLHWHLWAGLVVEGTLVLLVVATGAWHDLSRRTP
jgi:hypothetical protein